MKKSITLIALLCLVSALVACSSSMETKESSIFQRGEIKNCRITADNVQVKSGAGQNFKSVAQLKKNNEVNVLAEIKNWYAVKLDDNQVGCINSSQARPIVKEGEEPEPGKPAPRQDQPKDSDETEIKPAQNLSNMEQRMVNLINEERRQNGLSPLQVDSKVTSVARKKAQDMVKNNYFSHYSPTYGSPFDMLDRFGVEYLHAGENLAANSSVQRAHSSLMNSSGHRQNILSKKFSKIGVGIKKSNKYGYIFVQIFINQPK